MLVPRNRLLLSQIREGRKDRFAISVCFARGVYSPKELAETKP